MFINIPDPPEPVSSDTVTYSSHLHGWVQAEDRKTGQRLWEVQVCPPIETEEYGQLPRFILRMALQDGKLFLENQAYERFALDLRTRQVTSLGKPGPPAADPREYFVYSAVLRYLNPSGGWATHQVMTLPGGGGPTMLAADPSGRLRPLPPALTKDYERATRDRCTLDSALFDADVKVKVLRDEELTIFSKLSPVERRENHPAGYVGFSRVGFDLASGLALVWVHTDGDTNGMYVVDRSGHVRPVEISWNYSETFTEEDRQGWDGQVNPNSAEDMGQLVGTLERRLDRAIQSLPTREDIPASLERARAMAPNHAYVELSRWLLLFPQDDPAMQPVLADLRAAASRVGPAAEQDLSEALAAITRPPFS